MVEVLIYSAILSILVITLYQARGLLSFGLYQSINTSQAIIDSIDGISKLRKETRLSDVPIKVLNQTQEPGAPIDSDIGNCIEMQKLVMGEHQTFSISLRWDNVANAFKLVHYKTSGCASTPSAENVVDLSGPIFNKLNRERFFSGVGAVENDGYREINFNFSTSTGKGIVASGISNTSVQLRINNVTPHECRAASPDPSWFTDFGETNKIRTVTASLTQNFDPNVDRLRFEAAPNDLVVTHMDDLGILHLHAKDGLSVANWISLLVNVKYAVKPGTEVTESTPPKRISFVLGDGVSYSPSGAPSNHFYLSIKLDTEMSFQTADSNANAYCYPAFQNDPGYLGKTNNNIYQSCSDNYFGPVRLTGHLLTVSTEGEHEFIKNKVLNMVYPESSPYQQNYRGAFSNTINSQIAASDGKAWLGGQLVGASDPDTPQDSGLFKWVRGFEKWPYDNNRSIFANSNLSPRYMFAAPYFNSISDEYANYSSDPTLPILFNFSLNQYQKYWTLPATPETETASYLILEFGDNKGLQYPDQETSVNSQIRLKKDINIIPYEFFKSCKN